MKKLGILAIVALLLNACGPAEQSADSEKSIEDELAASAVNDTTAEEEELEDEYFLLPSPMQIGSIFQNSGLKYVDGVTHDPTKHEEYVTKLKQALNLGTYFADLTYCVLNDQTQQAITHLSAVKGLSEGIGLSAVFGSKNFMQRFENNLGNQDSILGIVIDVQDQMDYYIDENDMKDMESVIFTGGWVEGMYIGIEARDKMNKNSIMIRLIEQMTILNNLNKTLKSVDIEDEKWNEIRQRLIEIHTTFEKATAGQATGERDKLSDIKLDEKSMNKLLTSITDLRTLIIS